MQNDKSAAAASPTTGSGGKDQPQSLATDGKGKAVSTPKHMEFSDWGASRDSKLMKGPDPEKK